MHKKLHLYIKCIALLMAMHSYSQMESPEALDEEIDKGIALMFQKEHSQSIELLITTETIAKKNQWYEQAFRSTLNIGSNYYLLSDFGEAVQYYLQAYEIAIAHLDSRQEMTVLNNIGILYFQEEDLLQAKDYFFKAYQKAKLVGDEVKVGYYAVNLALVSNKMKAPDSAQSYIDEALPLLKNEPNVLVTGKMAQSEMFLLTKQYAQSEAIALNLLPKFQDISQVENRVFILLVLAQINEDQNRLDKALYYGIEARNTQAGIENREEVYSYLSNLYGKKGQLEKALVYKDSVIIASDSLADIRNSKLFETEKVKFQIQNYQHELSESKEVLKQERRFFYSIIGITVLSMGFILWIFRSNSIKHRQRKTIVELELAKEKSDYLLIEKQLREQETLALLEQERFKNELEVKNRKLTAKALYLSSKNDLIEEVVQSLSENTEISENPELKNQIRELKKHLKTDTQWDSFFTHFEEINQGFLDRLRSKHDKLTPSDIRYITYLYMNLSNKEIASLLNITPQSCRKRKERLSSKLSIPENVTLHNYLSMI
ncbi:tetratricopeptide repeat protein [Winogradskyella thalassocola]|uniref:Tetratricopeptide repeat-containing protein n=1 Tax=Winogradskyella thalassocola TaxID=262004 RepID=A0A1G8GG59_9FLAO|nr:tetratricopeptide repeat protein [Winogradskyella thalassocola]SDH93355.1 Tetratricopeptide repeat-containing protein [Winogradskyella thalassocola]